VRGALALTCAALGCAAPPTELAVVVDSELTPEDADAIVIDLRSPSGATGSLTVPPGAGPHTLALVPAGEALSPVGVAVRALRDDRVVLTAEVVTAFLEHERRAVPLSLDRDCLEVSCGSPDAVCARGRCVDRRVPARALPPVPDDL